MALPTVQVSEKTAARIRKGSLWIFDNEIESSPLLAAGSLVEVEDDGRYLATGYFNPLSSIRVRVLSTREEGIDEEFLRKRIERALSHRRFLGYPLEGSFRVVFGEGDLLPGLIVDKYQEYLVIQILTAGMEQWRGAIVRSLRDLLHPKGIAERSEGRFRKQEGLGPVKEVVDGEIPAEVTVSLHRLTFTLDLLEGQKTGFYLDQQENREMAASLAGARRVLDLFAYSGAFSLHAAQGGASRVEAVEVSKGGMSLLERNVQLNRMGDRITAVPEDVFSYLRGAAAELKEFDLVILDPPPFTKERGTLPAALAGYKEINRLALQIVSPGGVLLTSSCSQKVSLSQFVDLLAQASGDAGRVMQIVRVTGQSRDHPILPGMPETNYLKCVVARVF